MAARRPVDRDWARSHDIMNAIVRAADEAWKDTHNPFEPPDRGVLWDLAQRIESASNDLSKLLWDLTFREESS